MSSPISARKSSLNRIYSVGPDVCLTPLGSMLIPIGYNSVVLLSSSIRTSKSVRNNGSADVQSNTRAYKIQGHEAGSAKGIIHPGHIGAYATIREASSTVFSEGWQVVRDGDLAWINRPDEGPVEPRRSRSSDFIEHN